MQKARGQAYSPPTACKHTVSGSISLRFPRFFSPFPHGTGSLSVACEYLALGDGPPKFRQGSSYPALLGCSFEGGQSGFAYAAIMLYGETFQNSSATVWLCNSPGPLPPPQNKSHDPLEATPAGLTLRRFRLFRVRSPLLTESLICFLFLRVLRWFTSPGLLCGAYVFSSE